MTQSQLSEKAPETRRRLVPPPAAAEYLGGIDVGTLAKWRHYGRGPAHVRIGSRIFYDQSDLDQYIDAHRRTSTSTAA
jgi:Helix-turn-helix domain